jgi:hypothetical protein
MKHGRKMGINSSEYKVTVVVGHNSSLASLFIDAPLTNSRVNTFKKINTHFPVSQVNFRYIENTSRRAKSSTESLRSLAKPVADFSLHYVLRVGVA